MDEIKKCNRVLRILLKAKPGQLVPGYHSEHRRYASAGALRDLRRYWMGRLLSALSE